ncbi:alpha/beta hydrolase [Robiginitalea marina]|uniref:Alpha/beta hydrolase n=1 Tax=Robiginitalea marina TaxID=2954105 RepID=A0ABT1AXE0_9FLAO|nr:alpha/beta hydrolase fold domain-containing protein [Robiginitalea marina]MCO5724028.1 alpha/beta hydrolase [Robiginitalea marina]
MKNSTLRIGFILSLLFSLTAWGQAYEPLPESIEKRTLPFAERDSTLSLDFYQMVGDTEVRPCVIFVFGGSFVTGRRDAPVYNAYINSLVRNGWKVASIDYRLGLRGKYDQVGIFNTEPLENAIDLAVEDLFSATAFLVSRAGELQIDPANIILSGSSAGAITSLHGDLYEKNNHALRAVLPEGFSFKGVIAFAGAIFSTTGKPEYVRQPSPTLLFHGSEDKVVPFTKRRLLNKGFFGSDFLARVFAKNNYPYYYYREIGAGHEVATAAMMQRLGEVHHFLRTAVLAKSPYQLEATLVPLKK